ncbi:MAG: metal-sensing transcriptional repressor [Clostridiales bacterium]|nr:metal-sensing transcriptional repressor [Clostridiales bacterium]
MQADKTKINRLLKTARGQIDGILKMIEEDRYCVDISNQLMATQAILKRANQEIIRAHMKCCVKDAIEQGKGDEKIEELIGLIDKITK